MKRHNASEIWKITVAAAGMLAGIAVVFGAARAEMHSRWNAFRAEYTAEHPEYAAAGRWSDYTLFTDTGCTIKNIYLEPVSESTVPAVRSVFRGGDIVTETSASGPGADVVIIYEQNGELCSYRMPYGEFTADISAEPEITVRTEIHMKRSRLSFIYGTSTNTAMPNPSITEKQAEKLRAQYAQIAGTWSTTR